MKGTTHIAAGVLAGVWMSGHLDMTLTEALAATCISITGSLFPDIDSTTSKIGRKLGAASFLIQHTFGHRTLFHAPLLYFVLGYYLFLAFPEQSLLITAFLCGVVTHLVLDLLNPAGVSLLWPVNKRFRITSFQSGGAADHMLCAILWAAAVTKLVF